MNHVTVTKMKINILWRNLPCLTETYLEFRAATKLACGSESSNEKSSSLVTVLERVLSTAFEPIGLKYWPFLSRRANCPLWYSAENKQSLLQVSTNLPVKKNCKIIFPKFLKLNSTYLHLIDICCYKCAKHISHPHPRGTPKWRAYPRPTEC